MNQFDIGGAGFLWCGVDIGYLTLTILASFTAHPTCKYGEELRIKIR